MMIESEFTDIRTRVKKRSLNSASVQIVPGNIKELGHTWQHLKGVKMPSPPEHLSLYSQLRLVHEKKNVGIVFITIQT